MKVRRGTLFTRFVVVAVAMVLSCPLTALADDDAVVNGFGVTEVYPKRPGTIEWNSAHWAIGGPRTLSSRDALDPTGWSQKRGTGTLTIDGAGALRMNGTQPRMYINMYPDGSSDPRLADQRFRDVEVSVYFRRIYSGGEDYGGLVVGVRSGPMGHGAGGGNDCDATTYYARVRNDGQWDFAKELKHPSAANLMLAEVWGGQTLPVGQWIGLRYAVHTIAGGNVLLELWIDRTSGGVGGGTWQLLGRYTDTGHWNADADGGATDVTGCTYANDRIVDPGNGVVMIRNSSPDSVDLAEYRWLTIREIVAPDAEHLFKDDFDH